MIQISEHMSDECANCGQEKEELFLFKIPSCIGKTNVCLCADCIAELRKDMNETVKQSIEDKKKDINKVLKDFMDLNSAWQQCVDDALETHPFDIEDWLFGDKDAGTEYPFDKAMNEKGIEIHAWISGIQQQCSEALKRLEGLEKKFP